jgi:hypothetical protein
MHSEHSHKLNGDTPLRFAVETLLYKKAVIHTYKMLALQARLSWDGNKGLTREEMAEVCELAADRHVTARGLDERSRNLHRRDSR